MSAVPSEKVISETYGPFLTGIMLQQLLMGVLVVQVYDYYRVFVSDSAFNKWFVAVLFAVSVLQCTMDYKCLYRSGVQFYGNFDKFDDTDWTLWWEIGVTAIIGTLAQSFFLKRCWTATKSWAVAITGTAGILASTASGLASSIEFQGVRRLSRARDIPGPILTWLISSAVVDIAIAGVLIFSITRVKSRFRKTETIVGRIIRITFTTSALTATNAVINLVLYMALPGQAFHLLPQLSMGKIYAISCMVTLSSRSELRNILDSTGHSSFNEVVTARGVTAGQTFQLGATQSKAQGGNFSGIKVSTTTYIRDDNNQDLDSESIRKVDRNISDIEMGGDKEELQIPIQYPDGRVVRAGEKGYENESDEDVDYGAQRVL